MNLAAALRQAVLALDFPATADGLQGGQPLVLMPSIDLAVVKFAAGHAPMWANVLFSREHAGGVVAHIPPSGGPAQNIRFDADQRSAQGQSVAWLPGSNWARMNWLPLNGTGAHRFVAPYPASVLKLMVAVGVGLAADEGRLRWADALPDLEPMITVSDNDATDRCVALLHRCGWLGTSHSRLNDHFKACGLPTLQLHRSTPTGGWRNGDGAGVGQIHMTAWDTVRLLWLLDAEAPPAPWLAAGHPPLLQPATRDALRALLARQQLDEILSSGSLRDVPGWVAGLPDAPAFAHKTGTTENYGADAGIVRTEGDHYIVALFSNLGSRYAPHERCATTWRLPALGAAVHRLLTRSG
jgi:hypothetical protein